MRRENSIEALSAFFAAGVMAGSLVSGSSAGWVLAMAAPLLALSFFFRPIFPKTISQTLPVLFLFAGAFCTMTSSLPGASIEGPVTELAGKASAWLKMLIGSMPFESDVTSPLLTALITGDRSLLPPEVKNIFRESGASHLLALSGLHMGILYMIFDKLTVPFGKSPSARIIRYVLIVSAALFFTLMSGASPSLVRAFLFISINETLRILHRPRKATRVLCLALLIQLAIDPSAIGSIGFQLSYLAMAGIVLLYPIMERWYPESPGILPKIWKTAALSISCQAFTAPLVWMRFHTFPRHFIITNLLAIPVTTGLMACAVINITAWGAGIHWDFLIKTTDGLCRLLVYILEIISSM